MVEASHIAIIMDGNGRWAQRRGLARIQGHRAGAEVAKETALAARDMGLEHLTLFAFSTENWKRPPAEVQGIFRLLEEFFVREARELASSGIRVNVIGDRARLSKAVVQVVNRTEELSASANGMVLNIAINYGGRWDITQAAKSIAEDAAAGRLDPSVVDEALIASRLVTAGQPDVDLIIRTGGDRRISNFLLWQSAYAELYVTPTLWPDFGPSDLEGAIRDFASRERRYGAISYTSSGGEGE